MSEFQSLHPGELFGEFFEVERLLKSGGMGAVYVVRHRETGKRLALKLMHPDIVADAAARARFKREAQIASLIDSPKHIVDVQHAGIDVATGMPFIVMELLVGREIGDVLHDRGRLSPAEVVNYLRQTAKALDKAHAKGVVHRDLKPENLFLVERDDEPPTVKILDFGIAKILEAASQQRTQAAGTPRYMAPEQTSSTGKIGPATDVWALGLIAYVLLVGQSYWEGEELAHLLRQLLIDEFAAPSARASSAGVTLPPSFDAWMLRCLRRAPDERFQRAGEAIEALARALSESSVSAPSLGANGNATIQAEPLYPAATEAIHARAESASGRKSSSGTVPFAPTPTVAVFDGPPARSSSRLPLVASLGLIAAATVATAIFFFGKDKKPEASEERTSSRTSATQSPANVRSQVPTIIPSAKTEPPLDAENPFIATAGIHIQKYEVTRGAYARYLARLDAAARGHATPLDDANLEDASLERRPVTWVTFEQASEYCASIGAALPTSAEWAAALDGRLPWGSIWPPPKGGVAVARGDNARPVNVGTSLSDVTTTGIYDLGGNVQEWTSTVKDGLAVVRGAAIDMDLDAAREAIQTGLSKFTATSAGPNAKNEAIAGASVGFRCVR